MRSYPPGGEVVTKRATFGQCLLGEEVTRRVPPGGEGGEVMLRNYPPGGEVVMKRATFGQCLGRGGDEEGHTWLVCTQWFYFIILKNKPLAALLYQVIKF